MAQPPAPPHPWLAWLRDMPEIHLGGRSILRRMFGSIVSTIAWFGGGATATALILGPLPVRCVAFVIAGLGVAGFIASMSSRFCDGIGHEHVAEHLCTTGEAGVITGPPRADLVELLRLGGARFARRRPRHRVHHVTPLPPEGWLADLDAKIRAPQ